jgi:hypothetical protein
LTDEDTLRAVPPTGVVPPESWRTAPGWAPLLVIVVAGLGIVAFAVGFVPVTYTHDPTPQICTDNGLSCHDVDGTDTIFIECGSVFLPDFVSTRAVGKCAGTLQARRITVGLLTAGAILLALLGAKKSGSVGRTHTRAWDAFLVGGVFAVFMVVWTLAAWAITTAGALDSS